MQGRMLEQWLLPQYLRAVLALHHYELQVFLDAGLKELRKIQTDAKVRKKPQAVKKMQRNHPEFMLGPT